MANEKIQGMGFHHVALRVVDFDKSLQFYTEGLGLKITCTWGEGNGRVVMLDMGDGGILEMFAGGTEEERSNPHYLHLAFRVDDVDAAFQTALAAGATVKSEPKVVPVVAKPENVNINCGFVYGPSGEQLEFFRFV